MKEPQTYHVDLHFEADHVWAQVQELPGCFASGRDLDELTEALTEAVNMILGDEQTVAVKIEPEQSSRSVPARIELVPC